MFYPTSIFTKNIRGRISIHGSRDTNQSQYLGKNKYHPTKRQYCQVLVTSFEFLGAALHFSKCQSTRLQTPSVQYIGLPVLPYLHPSAFSLSSQTEMIPAPVRWPVSTLLHGELHKALAPNYQSTPVAVFQWWRLPFARRGVAFDPEQHVKPSMWPRTPGERLCLRYTRSFLRRQRGTGLSMCRRGRYRRHRIVFRTSGKMKFRNVHFFIDCSF